MYECFHSPGGHPTKDTNALQRIQEHAQEEDMQEVYRPHESKVQLIYWHH